MPAVCAHLPRLGHFWLRGSPRSQHPRPACRRAASQPLTLCFANATSGHNHDTNERILRYPDGNVRRIRYPAPVAEDAEAGEPGGDSWEVVSVWKAPGKARKPADQPPQLQQPAAAAAAPPPAAPAPPEQLPQVSNDGARAAGEHKGLPELQEQLTEPSATLASYLGCPR